VSTPKSRSIFERLGSADSTWIEYSGLRHELFNEIERRRVFADMTSWIRDRAEAQLAP
jgi:alpha-beta hydrolase superfamily lysophospholipase